LKSEKMFGFGKGLLLDAYLKKFKKICKEWTNVSKVELKAKLFKLNWNFWDFQ
jgi:hypothetical protein